MVGRIVPVKTYLLVFFALLALLAATVAASAVNLGPWNVVVALSIAVVKALMIALFFMHVRYSPRLTWIVAAAGFSWLGIMVVLTLSDYLTRGWLPVPPGR